MNRGKINQPKRGTFEDRIVSVILVSSRFSNLRNGEPMSTFIEALKIRIGCYSICRWTILCGMISAISWHCGLYVSAK